MSKDTVTDWRSTWAAIGTRALAPGDQVTVRYEDDRPHVTAVVAIAGTPETGAAEATQIGLGITSAGCREASIPVKVPSAAGDAVLVIELRGLPITYAGDSRDNLYVGTGVDAGG